QHAHPFTPADPYVSWPPLLSPLSSLFSSLSPLFLLSSSSPSILPHSECTHTHTQTHTHTHSHTLTHTHTHTPQETCKHRECVLVTQYRTGSGVNIIHQTSNRGLITIQYTDIFKAQ